MATEFNVKVYNVLSYIGCTRVGIEVDPGTGKFSQRYKWGWGALVYFLCHLNFLTKVTFVVLLSLGAFTPITDFFDWIAVLLWVLIICMILTSERLFYKIYPFFEILCSLWKIENDLYVKLNRDQDFKDSLKGLAKSRVILQTWIAVVGSTAMLFQYLATPKYCVFTYSAIEVDTLPLYIIFGAHELIFILHGWLFYGGIIYVSSCFGAELILCLNTLKESIIATSLNNRNVLFSSDKVEINDFEISILDDIRWSSKKQRASSSKPHSQIMGSIIMEYRKLTIFLDRLNEFASYNFLAIHVLAYCQMISDVYVMIQLLRMIETDLISIIFFAEDAGVCMYMLFKVFKSMSFVSAAAEDFHHELQVSLRNNKLDFNERKFLKKTLKSLRIVTMKIGPTSIGRHTVGTSMMTLMNYYVCAALW